MLIDCDGCSARDLACEDCVVSHLLGPAGATTLEEPERAALAVLADHGMVAPLRLLPAATTVTRVAG
ncbi:MAG TPA: hypothetical protein VFN19_04390 [Candidatus Nanopelagicales bacterium]|jgi:hypothetical protein|nr:hypothetical protein [Candidatus Nanopelagicales bacterium]